MSRPHAQPMKSMSPDLSLPCQNFLKHLMIPTLTGTWLRNFLTHPNGTLSLTVNSCHLSDPHLTCQAWHLDPFWKPGPALSLPVFFICFSLICIPGSHHWVPKPHPVLANFPWPHVLPSCLYPIEPTSKREVGRGRARLHQAEVRLGLSLFFEDPETPSCPCQDHLVTETDSH